MAVVVEVVETTEDFIILETTCDGVPTKRTSVHIDSIADGRTTIEEQIQKCKDDCAKRKARLDAMNDALRNAPRRKAK